jgi:hypothetical protein
VLYTQAALFDRKSVAVEGKSDSMCVGKEETVSWYRVGLRLRSATLVAIHREWCLDEARAIAEKLKRVVRVNFE